MAPSKLIKPFPKQKSCSSCVCVCQNRPPRVSSCLCATGPWAPCGHCTYLRAGRLGPTRAPMYSGRGGGAPSPPKKQKNIKENDRSKNNPGSLLLTLSFQTFSFPKHNHTMPKSANKHAAQPRHNAGPSAALNIGGVRKSLKPRRFKPGTRALQEIRYTPSLLRASSLPGLKNRLNFAGGTRSPSISSSRSYPSSASSSSSSRKSSLTSACNP
jgi:hypothetical protein